MATKPKRPKRRTAPRGGKKRAVKAVRVRPPVRRKKAPREPKASRRGARTAELYAARVPAAVMRDLRLAALGTRKATQGTAARLLGCGERTVWGWEQVGGSGPQGYAYVGLAWRIGGDDRAARVLSVLAQVDALEGVAVSAAS